jgi:hypothetical protein
MKKNRDNELKIRKYPSLPSPRVLYRNYCEAKLRDNKLKPWFVVGFCDAESSFFIKIYKTSKVKTG